MSTKRGKTGFGNELFYSFPLNLFLIRDQLSEYTLPKFILKAIKTSFGHNSDQISYWRTIVEENLKIIPS